MQLALKHGDGGWWSLDELEQFLNREGPIVEKAMYGIGYVRSDHNKSGWRKKKEDDKNPAYKTKVGLERITREEGQRLTGLWTYPNESAGVSKTYDLNVGKRGLIQIALWVNPFAGSTTKTLWMLGEQIQNRGHIARQQDGFYLEARQLMIEDRAGIYIKAAVNDERYAECVWPTVIPQEKVRSIATDLISRIRSMKQ